MSVPRRFKGDVIPREARQSTQVGVDLQHAVSVATRANLSSVRRRQAPRQQDACTKALVVVSHVPASGRHPLHAVGMARQCGS